MCFVLVRRLGMADLYLYIYQSEKWVKVRMTTTFWPAVFDLQDEQVKFYSGFNHEDIIVTYLQKGLVKQSEFFLFTTLTKESRLKKILE